jgi:hypothetical protein
MLAANDGAEASRPSPQTVEGPAATAGVEALFHTVEDRTLRRRLDT